MDDINVEMSLNSKTPKVKFVSVPEENTCPISKLCASFSDALIASPAGATEETEEHTAKDTLESTDEQQKLSSSTCQTPHCSPMILDSSYSVSKASPTCTPEINVHVSQSPLQTPLCFPIGIGCEEAACNVTPRRNLYRSCQNKSVTTSEANQWRRTILSDKVSKSRKKVNNVSSLQQDLKPNSDIGCTTSGKLNKKIGFKKDGKESSTRRPKNKLQEILQFEDIVDFSDLNIPCLPNKTVQDIGALIASEPRKTRKGDNGAFPARKLTFSPRSVNKVKTGVPDYDPDNDIFLQGVMPLQFNDDSLKNEIGKIFASSPGPLKTSMSCGSLKNIDTTSELAFSSPSTYRKKVSSSTPKIKRTCSAPNLLERTSCESKSEVGKASESTIRAFLRARDIIKNIRQRAKKNVLSHLEINRSEVEAMECQESPNTCEASFNGQTVDECVTTPKRTDVITRDDPLNTSDSSDLMPTQPFELLILRGVEAFVEVFSKNEDISAGVRSELIKLGATVVPTFNKDVSVTHVVFNDGLISTYKKAKKRNIPLVSVLWIEECRKAGLKVHESLYPPFQIERYESPKIVKELKKRKIKRFYSEERPKRTPLPRKSAPKDKLRPLNGGRFTEGPKKKSRSSPKWVDEVAGDNGMMRILVNMTGINYNQFKDLVNRPPTPEAETEHNLESPLAIRLIRQLAKEVPVDEGGVECDASSNDKKENNCIKKCVQSLHEVKKALNRKKDVDNLGNVEEKSTLPAERMKANTSSHLSEKQHSNIRNIGQKKKTAKRKLLGPLEDTVTLSNDEGDPERTVLQNPHASTIKRIRDVNTEKKRKSNNVNEASCRTASCSEIKSTVEENGNELNIVDPIRRSRRSSVYFVEYNKEPSTPVGHKPALVCTLLHDSEVELVASIVNKLGVYVVEKNVTTYTTHVIAGSQKRTLKILKGMVRGCWIVALDWVLKSLEADKWIDEEEYELTKFAPAMKKYRTERQVFGKLFKADLFNSCGQVFVSCKCAAPRGDLVQLILLGGGKITSKTTNADVVVGKNCPGKMCVKDSWILDSVHNYCLEPFDLHLYDEK